uniref:C-type lectin domain-containing protein n=1 Tax=Ditylenchus dipsaci TaxID=166011 RepID=A0A915EPK0_9BILA
MFLPQNSCLSPYRAMASAGAIICGPAPTFPALSNCTAPPPMQTSCYYAHPTTNFTNPCTALNPLANVVSIHSDAENKFVGSLVLNKSSTTVSNLIGLTLTHTSATSYAPTNSAAWLDNTPVDFGNPVVSPGVYPWRSTAPDNIQTPANCVLQYVAVSPPVWEDLDCNLIAATGVTTTVCKL